MTVLVVLDQIEIVVHIYAKPTTTIVEGMDVNVIYRYLYNRLNLKLYTNFKANNIPTGCLKYLRVESSGPNNFRKIFMNNVEDTS